MPRVILISQVTVVTSSPLTAAQYVFVDDDIVGDEGNAKGRDEGRFPYLAIADVWPLDAVALKGLLPFIGRGVHADTDDADAVVAHFSPTVELLKRVLGVVAPRRPHHDDVGLLAEQAVGDGIALCVNSGEAW